MKNETATAAVKEVKKDRFGARLGSQAARINAAIDGKPTLFETVAKRAELPVSRVRNHVRYWIKNGRIPFEVTEDDKVSVDAKAYKEALKALEAATPAAAE